MGQKIKFYGIIMKQSEINLEMIATEIRLLLKAFDNTKNQKARLVIAKKINDLNNGLCMPATTGKFFRLYARLMNE
jgi:uncharacterized protein YqgQ